MHVAHYLSEEDRQWIVLTCNQPLYASLAPGQIVPALVYRGSTAAVSAASTECCMLTARPTGAVVPGHQRSWDNEGLQIWIFLDLVD